VFVADAPGTMSARALASPDVLFARHERREVRCAEV
jgi:hypothetical protein